MNNKIYITNIVGQQKTDNEHAPDSQNSVVYILVT